MFDDERPKPKTQDFPRNLENMSVEELGAYIEALKAEIDRESWETLNSEASRDAAASVFHHLFKKWARKPDPTRFFQSSSTPRF